MKQLNHPWRYLLLFIAAIPIYFGAQSALSNPESDFKDMPTRRELFQALRQKGEITIVYPESSPALKALAKELSQVPSRWTQLEARSDQSLSTEPLDDKVLMLIGTPKSNRVIQQLLPHLPLQVDEHGIYFDETNYCEPGTVISLPFYPNPLNNKIPLMLLTAPDELAVVNLLEQKAEQERSLFRWSSWGYELYNQNCRLMMGHFDEKNWALTKEIHFDFSEGVDTLLQTPHFQFISHQTTPDPNYLEKVAHQCEKNTERIVDFLNLPAPRERVSIHLYGSAEEKGLMWHNTDHSHFDSKSNAVHTVFNEVYKDNLIGKENQLLLRTMLGNSELKALENGLAIYFTQQWQIKGYTYWANRLFHSENMPTLAEILDNRAQEEGSRLVLGCLAASFVEFLIQYWGKERFLANYSGWQPSPAEIHGLENAWHAYLAARPVAQKTSRQNEEPLPYLKGFNFAHQGYDIYNGYISRLAVKSLDKQMELNANAVAIVPYSFIRDPKQPSYISITDSPGSENDESVVHAAFYAKKRGMTTMLKPQIWLGHGSWPGDVEMQNEADWQQFFDHYYRWIRHYALMAEIHQMDILCIGTEFSKATLQREDDWRRMIRKIRQLYSGKITYAANWGEEFEQLQFWDELDYIGLDCYYPLSKKETPSKAELRANFKAAVKKMETVTERYNKPLLFTEIGFRSIEAPWKNPHADSDDADYNGDHQAICYQTVFEAIKGKDWCQGIFWWKFSTEPDDMGWENKGFTPNRKPAEEVVQEWFGRM